MILFLQVWPHTPNFGYGGVVVGGAPGVDLAAQALSRIKHSMDSAAVRRGATAPRAVRQGTRRATARQSRASGRLLRLLRPWFYGDLVVTTPSVGLVHREVVDGHTAVFDLYSLEEGEHSAGYGSGGDHIAFELHGDRSFAATMGLLGLGRTVERDGPSCV